MNRHFFYYSIFQIILGDVIQRTGIKNGQALRLAMKKMAESVKQPIAYNRLANMD